MVWIAIGRRDLVLFSLFHFNSSNSFHSTCLYLWHQTHTPIEIKSVGLVHSSYVLFVFRIGDSSNSKCCQDEKENYFFIYIQISRFNVNSVSDRHTPKGIRRFNFSLFLCSLPVSYIRFFVGIFRFAFLFHIFSSRIRNNKTVILLKCFGKCGLTYNSIYSVTSRWGQFLDSVYRP